MLSRRRLAARSRILNSLDCVLGKSGKLSRTLSYAITAVAKIAIDDSDEISKAFIRADLRIHQCIDFCIHIFDAFKRDATFIDDAKVTIASGILIGNNAIDFV